ncbi:acyl-CoA N-acyltransferase [Xylariomycetidae sp. FL0641]|nr:acyl-CoA N-acyltransferase [Xylariomycetidae sp. FL0641]
MSPDPSQPPLAVEPITDPADLTAAFRITANAFGRQTADTLWRATNPGWDTAAGEAAGAARLADRLRAVTTNHRGDPNVVMLKATLPSSPSPSSGNADASGEEKKTTMAGFAIWSQLSYAPGRGDPPSAALPGDLYPDAAADAAQDRERRFAQQALASLLARRLENLGAKRDQDQGEGEDADAAVFVLELCAVDPAAQRRGAASALVGWGLREARRRGLREATCEASVMGRGVYAKLGFREEEEGGGGEVVYALDEDLRDREGPSNVFMRWRDGAE